MKRLYDSLLQQDLKSDSPMLLISGPRQVGKTTISKNAEKSCSQLAYLNWDNEDDRQIILQGPKAIAELTQLHTLRDKKPGIVFDEIHKRPDWKNFLKGFFDTYGQQAHIIVTGSSRLDVYKKGGDSLMGRYFHFRMHPLSVAECVRTTLPKTEISKPKKINDIDFDVLFQFGGFPQPYIKRNKAFSTRWQNLRSQQLLREDIRDVNVIHDLNQLQTLMLLLKNQAAQQITYSNLAKSTRVSVDTITRWIDVLETFYYCFRIRPWTKNISRSLLKEPKVFLYDWSQVSDPGAKAENFVASHLLKAVQFWTDCGLGQYDLHYIRTREKKEVDFVVSKNNEAWFLVEVKLSNHNKISPHLSEFQAQSGATHAFQVILDMPYVNKDCFKINSPVIVPAKTFLSQLM